MRFSIINRHLRGYTYCGPGTKLTKRLTRDDFGVTNPVSSTLVSRCNSTLLSYTYVATVIVDQVLN